MNNNIKGTQELPGNRVNPFLRRYQCWAGIPFGNNIEYGNLAWKRKFLREKNIPDGEM
jgi:hypothetical protein